MTTYATSPPLDKASTKEEFLEKVDRLFDSVEDILAAHETWLEDSLDWTKKSEMSRLSRSWLDESLEEAKETLKLFSRYKRFKNRG